MLQELTPESIRKQGDLIYENVFTAYGEGETYEMFVPSFEIAKELERRYEPESSKDSSTCLGVPISWEGWNSYCKWTEYNSFDNCYLIEGSWWMPYWLLCPHKTINYEVWK